MREVKEEFGMTIKVGDPFYVFTYDNPVKGSHSIEVIYFAKFVEPLNQITVQKDDHSEYRWLSEKELPEIFGVGGKDKGDPEVMAMIRGFELLSGEHSLNFG